MTVTTIDKTITQVIDSDYKTYAMYSLENRAIPSYIDGLKPVGRLLLYAMINEHKGKRTKVNDLGSISKFGYHHGEISAMGAAITLAADWNNNVPIFRGYGNFGSRLIQSAAAPRYIFADLNPDFAKYFSDFDVCNPHSNDENPGPQQYLPVVPWVLVNGIEGIAVGFACRFLPHLPKDLAKACIKELKGTLKDDHVIPVTFPGFSGEVIQDEPQRVITRGIVSRHKKNQWLIDEVPYGYDREKFFLHLDKMQSKGQIQDFEDRCNKEGFKFLIKLDATQDEKASLNPIAYFGLERAFSENYTALDEHGKLIIFNSKIEIVRSFVNFRLSKVAERLRYDIKKESDVLNFNQSKLKFMNDVLDKHVDLTKYTKQSLIELCLENYTDNDEYASRLITIPIYQMTTDNIEQLKVRIADSKSIIADLENADPKEIFMNMLKAV